MNTLGDGDVSWMLKHDLRMQDILQYIPQRRVSKANIRIVFLGYYWKVWSLIDNGNFSALRGLDIRDDKPWEMGICGHYGIRRGLDTLEPNAKVSEIRIWSNDRLCQ